MVVVITDHCFPTESDNKKKRKVKLLRDNAQNIGESGIKIAPPKIKIKKCWGMT